MSELLLAATSSFVSLPQPMVNAQTRDITHDGQLLDYLNALRGQFNELLLNQAMERINATIPYRAGQVLDVDTSWIGRKKFYYKGATRFLVQVVRPHFWTRSGDVEQKYSRMFVNIHGFYLDAEGKVMRPELINGMPFSMAPSELHMEYLTLNTQGATQVVGISANQQHNYAEFAALVEADLARDGATTNTRHNHA